MNKERLLKLAEHLESGKLIHKQFDFNVINTDDDIAVVKGKCGTLGCALGELPAVFPNDWRFADFGTLLCDNSEYETFADAESFFDTDLNIAEHLFRPYCQDCDSFGGTDLNADATKEQVAANIRAFVARMESA